MTWLAPCKSVYPYSNSYGFDLVSNINRFTVGRAMIVNRFPEWAFSMRFHGLKVNFEACIKLPTSFRRVRYLQGCLDVYHARVSFFKIIYCLTLASKSSVLTENINRCLLDRMDCTHKALENANSSALNKGLKLWSTEKTWTHFYKKLILSVLQSTLRPAVRKCSIASKVPLQGSRVPQGSRPAPLKIIFEVSRNTKL